VKISPKRSLKSILVEGQTSRECHVKPAVPNSKGKAFHGKKIGEEDREVAWPACATCTKVARSARATTVLLRSDFKKRDFVLVWGD